MKKMQTLTVNGNAYQVSDPGAVCFAEAQSLTDEQKAQAKQNLGMGGQYELIEDVTLTEDVTSFSRSTDTNSVPYDFRALRVFVEVPACAAAPGYNQLVFTVGSKKNAAMIYHQANYAVATTAKTTYLVMREDHGFIDYYVGVSDAGVVSTISNRQVNLNTPWGNVSRLYLSMNPSGAIIPAGTRIQIYAVRG